MKKIISAFVVLAAAFTLVACGSDPTKAEVCGGCPDENVKAGCELGYDSCADLSDCSLGDYQSAVNDSGICG